jgi:hypothetical protein
MLKPSRRISGEAVFGGMTEYYLIKCATAREEGRGS